MSSIFRKSQRALPPADFKEIYAKYGTPELSPLKVNITKAIRNLEIKLD
jgi:hypothetical protein